MWLETYHVEDWDKFTKENEISLMCSTCRGEGAIETSEDKDKLVTCPTCGGSGEIEPMWNTIWNTGFYNTHQETPYNFPNFSVFAIDWNGDIWFGLTGCGMDLPPELLAAWVEFFPDCNWVPENWLNESNLASGYIAAVVGNEQARKIYNQIERTAEGMLKRAKAYLNDVAEAYKLLDENV